MSDVPNINQIFGSGESGSNSSDNPALNSIANQLWFVTYYLYGSGGEGQQADPLTFGMAMKAVNAFMTWCQNNPTIVSGDQYLSELQNDLTSPASIGKGQNTTLAALAADYTKNGFQQSDLNGYNALISGTYSHVFADFTIDLDQYGSQEGGFQKSTQSPLDAVALQTLVEYLQKGDLAHFLSTVQTLAAQIQNPPQDGVAQSLFDLFNTPLNPSDPDSTLSALAKISDAKDLQTFFTNNPGTLNEMQHLVSQYYNLYNQ